MWSWAQKRRTTVIAIAMGGLVLFLVASWRILFYEPATCSDGVQNAGERGIDCGGRCARLCPGDVLPPELHFARAVEVERGVWGAVAYLENRSLAVSRSAPYLFKLYDEHNLLVAERHGVTLIPASTVFAVFEGSLITNDRRPLRATFEFTSPLSFERATSAFPPTVSRQYFESGETSRLDATLVNPSLTPLGPVTAVALLFDASGNLFAASETHIPSLSREGSVALSFTWPRSLPQPARIEILSRPSLP